MTKSFGQTIREARKLKGYTQRSLAPELNVDYSYLSKLENGKAHFPSEELVRSLAQKLELNEEELVYLSGRIPKQDKDLLCQVLAQHPQEAIVFLKKLRRKGFQKRFIEMIREM
jgi:transcriptional regulator with XRE-family HTH domain